MQSYPLTVALITPFTHSGLVDYPALDALVKWHVEQGSDALVLCGSTGEGLLLDKYEQETILKVALAAADDKIAIFMSTGSPSTNETVANTKRAKDLGAHGCQIIVPYYIKAMERGLWQHFSRIAEVGLPTMIYHHPGRTGTRLSKDFLRQLATLPSVIGIKEASENCLLAKEIVINQQSIIYAGDDPLLLDYLENGALGIVSVMGNLIPAEWKKIIHLFMTGEKNLAWQMLLSYKPLWEAIFSEVNPQGIKYAVSLLGKCENILRLPLMSVSESTQANILFAMQKAGIYQTERSGMDAFSICSLSK